MREFQTGGLWVSQLAYTPDSRALIVDSRGKPTRHEHREGTYRPAHELVWWDWLAGTVQRRFRLVDALEGLNDSLQPATSAGATQMAFSVRPCRVVTSWTYSDERDLLCEFDLDQQARLRVDHSTRTYIDALACEPDGTHWLAACVNNQGTVWWLECQLGQETGGSATNPVLELNGAWGFPWFGEIEKLCCAGPYVAAANATASVRFWDTTVPIPEAIMGWDGPRPRTGLQPGVADCEVGFVPACLAGERVASLVAVGGTGLGVYQGTTASWRPFGRADHAPVTALSLEVGGQLLLVGTEDGRAELWHAEAARLVSSWAWDEGPITAVAFAPDGHTCAAGTAAGRVLVWDRDR